MWAVSVADGTERKVLTATGRVDAPSWGPASERSVKAKGQIVYHVATAAAAAATHSRPHATRWMARRSLAARTSLHSARRGFPAPSRSVLLRVGRQNPQALAVGG